MDTLISILTSPMMIELLWIVGSIFAVIVPLLIAVAYLTLAERRVIGLMQLRRGPNVVGPFGLFSLLPMRLSFFQKKRSCRRGHQKLSS